MERLLPDNIKLKTWLLWSHVFVIARSQVVSFESEAEVSSQWSPSWSCVNDRCIRNETALVSNPDLSLSVCRLTCGPYGALWPKPTGRVEIGSDVLQIHPSQMVFTQKFISQATDNYIESITHLFVKRLSKRCGVNCVLASSKVKVYLSFEKDESELVLGVDEGYSLTVAELETNERDSDDVGASHIITVAISATTIFGVRHGLETFYQLITRGSENSLVLASNVTILNDSPYFRHRGVTLDTARHFIPLTSIKRQIDAMAANKMNVLHWHVTDSHSFPLVLERVPMMSRFGAYSPAKVYSTLEVKYLIQYAKLRGIRIILELDAPAHAGQGWQWGPQYGMGDLVVCLNAERWRANCIQPPCGQLNPINTNVYTVLKDIYGEMLELTNYGDAGMFHMGADEVFIKCWNNTPAIVDFMRSHGKNTTFEDYLNLWAHFQNKAAASLDEAVGHNRTRLIVWSSHLTDPTVIENYLHPERYIIQTWVPRIDPLPEILTSKGYQVIISTKDAWYLDHGFWGLTSYYRWTHVYDNLLPSSPLVLGGEVALWSEYIDEQTLDARLWPRAAAAAERLWSNPRTAAYQAEVRFLQQRERLVEMGVRAEVTTPEWCYLNDGQCR